MISPYECECGKSMRTVGRCGACRREDDQARADYWEDWQEEQEKLERDGR